MNASRWHIKLHSITDKREKEQSTCLCGSKILSFIRTVQKQDDGSTNKANIHHALTDQISFHNFNSWVFYIFGASKYYRSKSNTLLVMGELGNVNIMKPQAPMSLPHRKSYILSARGGIRVKVKCIQIVLNLQWKCMSVCGNTAVVNAPGLWVADV
jgi:hypothetical protein